MHYQLRSAVGFVLLSALCTTPATAAIIGSIQSAGALSALYTYSESPSGRSTSSRSLTLNTSFDSFLWQPWLISWSANLRFSLAESGSSTEAVNGGLTLEVLPRSRFPMRINYSRTDSVTTSRAETRVDISSERRVSSSSFGINQRITTRSGALFTAWYNKISYEAPAYRVGESDIRGLNRIYGGNFSKRLDNQSFEVNYSENQSESDGGDSARKKASLMHNYSPEREFSVDSVITSETSTEPSRERFDARSAFFWRPEYSDFSVNGSIKATERSVDGGGASSSIGAQLSGNHKLSRTVGLSASISAALDESEDGARSGSSSQNIGISYGSDSSIVGAFTWNWNSGLSLSNSIMRGGVTGDSESLSVSASLGHAANRQFRLSRISSLSLSLGQGGSLSKSVSSSNEAAGDGELSKSLNHSVSTGYTTSIEGGSASLWLSLSDNRDLTRDTEQQTFRTNFQRNETLSRQSHLSGNLNYNLSRHVDPDGRVDINEGSSGSMRYGNSRFMGIHRLVYNSELRLSEAGSANAGAAIASSWVNNFTYALGLLSMGFAASYTHVTGADGYSQYYMFSVTRSF